MPFVADSHKQKLEGRNYQAARVITGAPKGSPLTQTCAEAGIPALERVSDEEAALLYHKYSNLDPGHYLNNLTTTRPHRQRLRSRGESGRRQDWRTSAQSRLSHAEEEGINIKEAVKKQRDAIDQKNYDEKTDETTFHRRATGGCMLTTNVNRSREEEVLLMNLRLNRASFLQQVAHRHQREDSPICIYCETEEEDAEHFLLRCEAWEDTRTRHLGAQPVLTALQDAPEAVLAFCKGTGRWPAAIDPRHQ